MAQLALMGGACPKCASWHLKRKCNSCILSYLKHSCGGAVGKLADAPRDVLEYATPLARGAPFWEALAARGRLDVLQWGRGAHGLRVTPQMTLAAARGGHVHVLYWLHEPWTTQTTHDALKAAAFSGKIGALDWLIARCDWRGGGAAACAAAAAAGQLIALKYLRACGSAWDHDTISEAAGSGQLEVLEWVFNCNAPLNIDDALGRAAQHGQLASLEWFEYNTYNYVYVYATLWNEDVFASAAASGDVALLEWLRQRDCECDEHASRMAAMEGSVEALQWLRDAGAPIALEACDVAYDSREDAAFELAYGYGLPVSGAREKAMAARGDVARLEWLRVRGHEFESPADLWACADARSMRWLHAHGFPCDARAMRAALAAGDAAAVRLLLFDVGSDAWDGGACVAAAAAGDLASLALLHATCRATGGGHDEDVCAAAAAGGYGDALRWARGEGCAWDARVCAAARANGHLDVLKWAMAEGCPCGEADLRCLP